jgi:hypothetical protein
MIITLSKFFMKSHSKFFKPLQPSPDPFWTNNDIQNTSADGIPRKIVLGLYHTARCPLLKNCWLGH